MEINLFLQDAVIKGLYRREALYNLFNRAFDNKILGKWQSSIDFPRNPQVYVGIGPVTQASGNRTKVGNMDKVNVPFSTVTAAIDEEAESYLMSDGEMSTQLIGDIIDGTVDKLDELAISAALAGIPVPQIIQTESAEVGWKDMTGQTALLQSLKMGAKNFIHIIPPLMAPQVKNIDVIKTALGTQSNIFTDGIYKIDGNFYVFTGQAIEVGAKPAILTCNPVYVCVAIKKWMDKKSGYNEDTQVTSTDYLSYAATGKTRSQSVVALINQ